MKTLSIIIPVYNEQNTVYTILERINETKLVKGLTKEIILVNDGSTDNSAKKIKEFIDLNPEKNIKYVEHEINKGKGAAIRTGFENFTGDIVLIQDSDLEYDPAEYNDLISPILNNKADVVYGSRFMGGKPHRILFFWHSIGNKFLTFLSNMLTNLNLTDMETCFKAFKKDIAKKISIKENRFGFEPEITAKIAKIPNIRIYEIGVSYYGRTYEEGKKIKWKDGVRAIYCIFKYNFFR